MTPPEVLHAAEAVKLRDWTRPRLRQWVVESGQPAYRGDQLFEWLWKRGVSDFSAMLSLPSAWREALPAAADATSCRGVAVHLDSLDGTRKLLIELDDGKRVEAVILADRDRRTLCASSQVGCSMGCAFCYTARSKVQRNLEPREILAQFTLCEEILRQANEPGLSNIVFMGMGEPLANLRRVKDAVEILCDPKGLDFSRKKITVSTVGLAPRIPELVDLGVNLAISLNAPNDAIRRQIMPIENAYPLKVLIEAARDYAQKSGRRVTFEYVLLGGVNDRPEHAQELVRLLQRLRFKVNLIPFNEFPGSGFRAPLEGDVEAFQALLRSKGVDVFRRRSRGQDILAACGQLAGKGEVGTRPAPSMDLPTTP